MKTQIVSYKNKGMEYNEDHIKRIVILGTLGYGVEKCINVLDVEDEAQFRADFANPSSAVGKAYQKGKGIADFAIDSKLFEKAKSGDLQALKQFEQRKRSRL